MGDEIKPVIAALRAKLAEMEKSVSVDERQADQLRLSIERQREDIVAMRRSISLLEQVPVTVAPSTTARHGVGESTNRALIAHDVAKPDMSPFDMHTVNGHLENPARMDSHILALVKASPRPLGPINIRDALLKCTPLGVANTTVCAAPFLEFCNNRGYCKLH